MTSVVGFDKSKMKRVTCRECAAIIEYTRSEIQEHWSKDYTGVSDLSHYIECPNCKHNVHVSKY